MTHRRSRGQERADDPAPCSNSFIRFQVFRLISHPDAPPQVPPGFWRPLWIPWPQEASAGSSELHSPKPGVNSSGLCAVEGQPNMPSG